MSKENLSLVTMKIIAVQDSTLTKQQPTINQKDKAIKRQTKRNQVSKGEEVELIENDHIN